ncbi:MAG: glycosyltransferase family 2 protein [Vicinamibacteria bacterium]|nr:glycosyltransferase family 2 protein [Vicinamibacteria bacterium]
MSAPLPEDARGEPKLSLVVPICNEQEVLPLLVERLRGVMDGCAAGCEAILVNDGSVDGSWGLIAAATRVDPRFKALDFSRNFGHPAAITAGLDHASGDAIVVMDADLQDPPELVPKMVALYREGWDVVHARRSARQGETAFKKLTAEGFYKVMGLLADRPPTPNVGEFRLISRAVVDALGGMRERHRLVRGLVSWLGFRQTTLDFERPGRAAGETKFPFRRMFRLSWDALTAFSVAPLRLALVLGVLALLLAIPASAALLLVALAGDAGAWGWPALLCGQMLLAGATLVCLGLLGDYVGRIYDEVRGRPLYVVRQRLGLAAPARR